MLLESVVMKPAQMGRVAGYISGPFASGLHRLKRRLSRTALYSMAGNAVLVPVSQGTEVTITEYVPFRYFTRKVPFILRCKWGMNSTMPCYGEGTTEPHLPWALKGPGDKK